MVAIFYKILYEFPAYLCATCIGFLLLLQQIIISSGLKQHKNVSSHSSVDHKLEMGLTGWN